MNEHDENEHRKWSFQKITNKTFCLHYVRANNSNVHVFQWNVVPPRCNKAYKSWDEIEINADCSASSRIYDRSFRFLATDLFFHFSCFPLTGRTDAQCGCLKNFGRSTRLLSLSKAAAAAAASFIVQPCNCVTYRHSPRLWRVYIGSSAIRDTSKDGVPLTVSYPPLSTQPLWTKLQLAAKILSDFFHVPSIPQTACASPFYQREHFTSPRELVLFCIEYILRLRNENGTEINMQRLSFE